MKVEVPAMGGDAVQLCHKSSSSMFTIGNKRSPRLAIPILNHLQSIPDFEAPVHLSYLVAIKGDFSKCFVVSCSSVTLRSTNLSFPIEKIIRISARIKVCQNPGIIESRDREIRENCWEHVKIFAVDEWPVLQTTPCWPMISMSLLIRSRNRTPKRGDMQIERFSAAMMRESPSRFIRKTDFPG